MSTGPSAPEMLLNLHSSRPHDANCDQCEFLQARVEALHRALRETQDELADERGRRIKRKPRYAGSWDFDDRKDSIGE